MLSVADELAALRAKGSVKNLSTNLSTSGGGLSTPEAVAAALKAKREGDKLGSTNAKEILNKGSSAAAQASAARAAIFAAKKKDDREKKAQATEILNKGGSSGGYSQQIEHTLNQTGKKKAEWEKKEETKREMAGSVAKATTPQADTKSSGTVAVETKASNKDQEPATVEKEETEITTEPSPIPFEKKELAPASPLSVVTDISPISAAPLGSVAKEPNIGDTTKNGLDPTGPVEITDGAPKPAVADATTNLDTIQIDETESEDDDDEAYKDFLKLLKS